MSTIQFKWRGVMVEADFFIQRAEPDVGIMTDYLSEISSLRISGSNVDILEMLDGLYLGNEISAIEDLEQRLIDAIVEARGEAQYDSRDDE